MIIIGKGVGTELVSRGELGGLVVTFCEDFVSWQVWEGGLHGGQGGTRVGKYSRVRVSSTFTGNQSSTTSIF